jgi:hypothetical protein
MCSRSADAGCDHHRCSGSRADTARVGELDSPNPACREACGPATQAVVTRNGPHPLAERELSPPGTSLVVLAGRATHVP